jgi:hypothetical protein
MKYDMLFMGLPRSGTASIFSMLARHSNITPSFAKEPLNTHKYDDYSTPFKTAEVYKKNFRDITLTTKILMDGTPSAYHAPHINNIIKLPWINQIKILYNLRNPIKRISSYLKLRYVLSSGLGYLNEEGRRFSRNFFTNGKIINEDYFYYFLNNLLDHTALKRCEERLSNNIYIVNNFNFNFKEMFEFLEIEQQQMFLPRFNSTRKFGIEIDDVPQRFFEENKTRLRGILNDDVESVQDDYQIDLNNILEELKKW